MGTIYVCQLCNKRYIKFSKCMYNHYEKKHKSHFKMQYTRISNYNEIKIN